MLIKYPRKIYFHQSTKCPYSQCKTMMSYVKVKHLIVSYLLVHHLHVSLVYITSVSHNILNILRKLSMQVNRVLCMFLLPVKS